MLMNSAARVLKKSIQYIDKDIIRKKVEKAFVWNMLFIDDPSIKGDVRIEASGAMGLFVKEQQQLRLQEYMSVTSNPEDRRIMGDARRAALLRAAAAQLPLSQDEVVPTKEEIEAREEQEKQAAQAQAAQEQAAQAATAGPQVGAPASPSVGGVQPAAGIGIAA